MIYFSETLWDSSVPPNSERLYMKGYKLIRADNLSNSKEGDVSIYSK